MKIIKIILIASIPIVLIVGGLYLVSNIKKDNIIKDAISSIDDSYYQELAKQCGEIDKSLYKCCLASVYDMIEVKGKLSTDSICANLVSEQLKCPGSFEWCVPLADVTTPDDDMVGDNDQKKCLVDEDCVPASCCHATNVVNKDFAPDCKEVMCTMSCETVLDCGQGQSVCNDSICEIEKK